MHLRSGERGLHIRPASSPHRSPSARLAAQLDTTYLDDTIRICRGAGSGVPFVFRADSCAEGAPLQAAADEWRTCFDRPPLRKLPLATAVLAAAAGSGVGLLRPLVPRWCGLLLAAAAAALLRSTGGIVVETREGEKSTPEVAAAGA